MALRSFGISSGKLKIVCFKWIEHFPRLIFFLHFIIITSLFTPSFCLDVVRTHSHFVGFFASSHHSQPPNRLKTYICMFLDFHWSYNDHIIFVYAEYCIWNCGHTGYGSLLPVYAHPHIYRTLEMCSFEVWVHFITFMVTRYSRNRFSLSHLIHLSHSSGWVILCIDVLGTNEHTLNGLPKCIFI